MGDETGTHEFEVPTADAGDAYLGVQAFDVDEYGHGVLVNGDRSSGFDIPPSDGWQHWVDALGDAVSLGAGTNGLRIARDTDTDDAFAVGTVTIHWKEPSDA